MPDAGGRASDPVHVAAPARSAREGWSRVEALVDGTPVWFESRDVDLEPAGEAFVAAFLIPALAAGRRLAATGAVGAAFAARLPSVVTLAHRWWHYPRLLPEVAVTADARTRAPGRTALAFSGGIDSFHALLRRAQPADLLVFVHGFDMALADEARARNARASAEAVAAALGARAVMVRTNLREHPLFRRSNWEETHGGALGAVAHALSGAASRFVIGSSYPRTLARPWGSHWDLDPLWSGAGMTVEHFGEDAARAEKVAAVGHEPLVLEHLRVCWENRADAPNCSRCSKCVRTRLMLAAAGALDRCRTLDGAATLARDVDALPSTGHARSIHHYRNALSAGLPPDAAAAVRRLLARSRWHVPGERLADHRWARRLAGLARRLARYGAAATGEPATP